MALGIYDLLVSCNEDITFYQHFSVVSQVPYLLSGEEKRSHFK